MAKINLNTFKPQDLEGFRPQPMQVEEYTEFKKYGKDVLEWLKNAHNTITIARNGTTIAVLGVVPLHDFGGNVWLFFSEHCGSTDLVIATRMVNSAFEALKEEGFQWLQTPIRADFAEGCRWAKILGFEETEVSKEPMEHGTKYKIWMKEL